MTKVTVYINVRFSQKKSVSIQPLVGRMSQNSKISFLGSMTKKSGQGYSNPFKLKGKLPNPYLGMFQKNSLIFRILLNIPIGESRILKRGCTGAATNAGASTNAKAGAAATVPSLLPAQSTRRRCRNSG